MEDLKLNAMEFESSGEDNLKKERWNAAVADFFRAISNNCDYLIYKQIKIIPKNHNERFNLLEKYFPKVYKNIRTLFEKYRESYNIRLSKEDALFLKKHLNELKSNIPN